MPQVNSSCPKMATTPTASAMSRVVPDSGTQEGSPIDRVLGTLARSFNLERKVQPPILGSTFREYQS